MSGFAQTDTVLYVVQGEYRISSDPQTVLSTVLGSCVAVCLYDPVARKGGMNHFLLPFGQATEHDRPIRYGLFAMEKLINELIKAGCAKHQLEAKIFGGARITPALTDIGAKNAVFAKTFLGDEGITCRSESVGGTLARRVIFRPTTGHVRQLLVADTDVAGQSVPNRPLQTPKPTANIELF